MSYTNEELEKIYKDACNYSISDKELDNIKEALYSLSSIVKFNPVEYARLIKILKRMPKDKLDKIIDNLVKTGRDEAAMYLQNSVAEFEKGNMMLNLALSMINAE